ncbi:MAG: hypothetical protein KAY22_02610 [Rhizorhabdus sp.]|uniref:hypothetical protein n=1 Tax=Rhizorhabdus sp. TaxID=1968843 RepID=UPI001B5B0695|nr:hypothetical protein [Rhizorhabdus sp.]MBP8231173.1 hypothetical protein [Rhizorhabdus sp.]
MPIPFVAIDDAICFQSLEGCCIVASSEAASTAEDGVDTALSALAGRYRPSIGEMDARAESMLLKGRPLHDDRDVD